MGLVDPAQRAAASEALARRLGGETLIVFVRDPEIDVMLSAPGFPQTLPNGRQWRRFLDECIARGDHSAELTLTHGAPPVPAFGISTSRDFALVLLGCGRPDGDIEWLCTLLPALAAVFRGEIKARVAEAKEKLARDASHRAEQLSAALDEIRRDMQRVLSQTQQARAQLEEANLQLQDQATEMEAQTNELELQADELLRSNAELELSRRMAEDASRAKSSFLATMSHELRTPLNAIAGHVQLMEMGIYGPLTADQRTALERVNRSQRHLLGLINDVLNLARIEAGRVDYNLGRVPLAQAIRDMAPMIEPQIEARKLTYTVRVDDETLCVVADRDKLQQVLLNLLSNAVKFTAPGGSVSVAIAEHDESTVQLQVIDTGVGIPAHKLRVIFDPFVQVDSSHSREGQGTGLGLAISRDLAMGMGGDIRVESEFGKGSTFMLTLPAAK